MGFCIPRSANKLLPHGTQRTQGEDLTARIFPRVACDEDDLIARQPLRVVNEFLRKHSCSSEVCGGAVVAVASRRYANFVGNLTRHTK